jgi:hypothetical protein
MVWGGCKGCTYDQANVIDIPFISRTHGTVFGKLFLRKGHDDVQSTNCSAVVIPIRFFLVEVSVFFSLVLIYCPLERKEMQECLIGSSVYSTLRLN